MTLPTVVLIGSSIFLVIWLVLELGQICKDVADPSRVERRHAQVYVINRNRRKLARQMIAEQEAPDRATTSRASDAASGESIPTPTTSPPPTPTRRLRCRHEPAPGVEPTLIDDVFVGQAMGALAGRYSCSPNCAIQAAMDAGN
jgi:hypothetical protein